MGEYWFEPKLFGWGFMPVTWEGWIATLVMLGMLAISIYTNGLYIKRDKKDFRFLYSKQMMRFVFDMVMVIAVFVLLFGDKVDGGLQWRFF